MARPAPEHDFVGQLSRPKLAALLEGEGLMEAPHETAINWQGVLHMMQSEPLPGLTMLGWAGRTPVAIRVGETIIRREPGEGLDHLRARVAREFGGLGQVGHYCYPRGTR